MCLFTYPIRQVDLSLISDEFKDTAVRDSVSFLIGQLEQHWINDVEPGELLQSRRWHDYCGMSESIIQYRQVRIYFLCFSSSWQPLLTLAPALDVLTIGPGQHGHGETLVLGVERPRELREHVESKLKLKSHANE